MALQARLDKEELQLSEQYEETALEIAIKNGKAYINENRRKAGVPVISQTNTDKMLDQQHSDGESDLLLTTQSESKLESRGNRRQLMERRLQRNLELNRKQIKSAASIETPKSIAALTSKLQQTGDSWRSRLARNNNATQELKLIETNNLNIGKSEQSFLSFKRDQLDTASKRWKDRIEKRDVEDYRNNKSTEATLQSFLKEERITRSPKASKFKGKSEDKSEAILEKNALSKNVDHKPEKKVKIVPVLEPNDATYESFFKNLDSIPSQEKVEISIEDFDSISRETLLGLKKSVPFQKRRIVSKNPIKALLDRKDLASEYQEELTGVVEREQKRLMLERVKDNLKSDKSLEALRGLASTEDFTNIALKTPKDTRKYPPYKPLMLIQIKGRKHVQVRLVEPNAKSINEGDCYLLVGEKSLFVYTGAHSNIIEQSRALDIAEYIRNTHDMGCKTGDILQVSKAVNHRNLGEFWSLLDRMEIPETVDGGHPDEDESYETNIVHTNMIYSYYDNALVPMKEVWGSIPKIKLLGDADILVFDFGSEMYVWSGKSANKEQKTKALNIAEELFNSGYNYTDCSLCPLDIASNLGKRLVVETLKQDTKRPDWAIFAKLSQHRESVLFQQKFHDWKEFRYEIKEYSKSRTKDSRFCLEVCDPIKMLAQEYLEPDLVVQDQHLGRGGSYFDDETRRLFEFQTLDITAWKVIDNDLHELEETSLGQFCDEDSYIYKVKVKINVKGRELTGKPSKHMQSGRDKTLIFSWHGLSTTVNDKCAAALLSVDLVKENGPQIQLYQGTEPPVFLRLFNGLMCIHSGKKSQESKLFISRAEIDKELHFMEVPLDWQSLRSRTSFALFDWTLTTVFIWHGSKAAKNVKRAIVKSVKNLLILNPLEFSLGASDWSITQLTEGVESKDFMDVLGSNSDRFFSLKSCLLDFDYTVRVFQFSSITGHFVANELLCPHRSGDFSPYPFLQSELYNASQPALFLVDNNEEVWLWQGWWPDDQEDMLTDHGSAILRWQCERKSAMQSTLNYWKSKGRSTKSAFMIYAGLEPPEFKALFPLWLDRPDVASCHLKDEVEQESKLLIEVELSYLTRNTYPLNELLQRPLPDGVDPRHLEMYLSDGDFQGLLLMTKEEFQQLPRWKQTKIKKEHGLF